jgi:hypothetical protein
MLSGNTLDAGTPDRTGAMCSAAHQLGHAVCKENVNEGKYVRLAYHIPVCLEINI